MMHTVRKLLPSFWLGCLTLLIACLAPAAVFAADADNAKGQSPMVVNLKQFKVIKDAKGETKYLDASVVLPGDVLEYQATYTNRGTVPLVVTATLPLPEAVEYLKDSAKAKPEVAHSVALKDNQFGVEPLSRKVSTSGSASVMQQVPYAEYRFVRWDLGRLAAGASAEVSIRAQVSQNVAADSSTGGKLAAEPAVKK